MKIKDLQKSKELAPPPKDLPKNLAGALEALLFIYGEPMSLKKAQELLRLTKDELKVVLKELEDRLTTSGLLLLSHNGSIQLVTRPEHATLINDIVKLELSEELTPAALETLSIV
jgi:segregation and condensation protein B